MLDVNTLPKSYRKVEELTSIEMFSVEIAIEKERKKEGKNISKQSEKVARYVVRRQLTSYLGYNIASAPSDRCSKQQTETSPNHWEILIKYQKRPTIVSSRRPSFQFQMK
jgi:hypothetical protein